MKKNDMWKRARRIPVMLITEGLCVGLIGGFIVLLYRVALTFAGNWLIKILSYIKGNPFQAAGFRRWKGKYPGAFLRIGNECCRQNLQADFYVCWEGFRLEEKARRFSLERWPDREYPELWGGGKEKRSF